MQVAAEVLAVLERCTFEANHLTLPEQLERSLYVKTDKVIQAAGGAWNRKAKAHVFGGEAFDRIEQILLTGSIDVPKDDFEFFPTPAAIVEMIIDRAQLDAGMSVLEPSCGRGAIIQGLEGIAQVHAIEKMAANYEFLKSLSWLASVRQADFLEVEPDFQVDRVLMNPPFSKQADIKHVLHALRFVKPDGLLVAVMASSVTFRTNRLTEEFRDLVNERNGRIESLPEGSFKTSGTGVNTVLVTIPGQA